MSKKTLPDDVLEYFRQQGARGAKIATANMTAAQRKARAIKASQAATAARAKRATGKKTRRAVD